LKRGSDEPLRRMGRLRPAWGAWIETVR